MSRRDDASERGSHGQPQPSADPSQNDIEVPEQHSLVSLAKVRVDLGSASDSSEASQPHNVEKTTNDQSHQIGSLEGVTRGENKEGI